MAPSRRIRIARSAAFVGAGVLLYAVVAWPAAASYATGLLAGIVALFCFGLLSFIDLSLGLKHPRNLAVLIAVVLFAGLLIAHEVWRAGSVVARASFNPGIAPFVVTVRKVPVPVTGSSHFIVTLRRGRYPVTSFRYFWVRYTPKKVKIEWPGLGSFRVIFDDRYVATCTWSWGKDAVWSIQVPPGGQVPGDQP
jgi:hypothetical protein